MKKTGDIIKSYREKLKYSTRDLAEKVGTSPTFINSLEKDRKNFPKTEVAEKIIEALKISPEDVVAIKIYEDYKKTPKSIKKILKSHGTFKGKDSFGNYQTETLAGSTTFAPEGIPISYFANPKNRLATITLGVYEGVQKIGMSSQEDDFDYKMAFTADFGSNHFTENNYFALEVLDDDSMSPLINTGNRVIISSRETIDEKGRAIDLDRKVELGKKDYPSKFTVYTKKVNPEKEEELEVEYKEKRKYYVITFDNKTFIREIISPTQNLIILRCLNSNYKDIYVKGKDINKIKIYGRILKVVSEKKL